MNYYMNLMAFHLCEEAWPLEIAPDFERRTVAEDSVFERPTMTAGTRY
jgi:hypothetical protein